MRILIVTQHYRPERCAPAERMGTLVDHLLDAGHDVRVVAAIPNHPDGAVPPWYRSWRPTREVHVREGRSGAIESAEILRAPLVTLPNRGALRRALSHGSFALTSALMARFRAPLPRRAGSSERSSRGSRPPSIGPSSRSHRQLWRRPDLILATSPPLFGAWAAGQLARAWRVPFILDLRDLWPALFSAMGLIENPMVLGGLEAVERATYRSAAHIVAVSPGFSAHLVDRGVAADRISVLPNGAETSFWTPGDPPRRAESPQSPKTPLRAVYAGNHGLAQGLDVLFSLLEPPTLDLELTFVGSGTDKPRLQRLAEERGLQVTFRDPVDRRELRAIYRNADIGLVSLKPGAELGRCVPSKLFEWASCGTPTLSALQGAGAEVARSLGQVVVQPGDGAAVRAGFELLRASEERRSRGQAGRDEVVSRFGRSKIAADYEALMMSVTSLLPI